MTGLDPDSDEIIEIFCVITTGALEVVDPAGWGTVVHQSRERMDMMDEWCTRTHAKYFSMVSILCRVTLASLAHSIFRLSRTSPSPSLDNVAVLGIFAH